MVPRTFAPLAALALAAVAAAPFQAAAQGSSAGRAPATPAAPLSPVTTSPAAAAAAATITPADMYARIEFLASDLMRGRNTPSPELEIAASYLVNQYKLMGFTPGGEGGTFIQRYPYPRRQLDTASVHFGTVNAAGQNAMLQYGRDFYVSAAPNRGGVDMNHGTLAWVGEPSAAGLPAADYKPLVPVFAIRGPYNRDWRLAYNRARQQAEDAGAVAVVIVADSQFADSIFRLRAAEARSPMRAQPRANEAQVFVLTQAAARALAARAGLDLARQPAAPRQPVPFRGLQAHFAAFATELDHASAPNVVAILPGSDPALKDEYVVVSAHMDHVGVGRPVNGDSIYNGADDDASGTAGILEVAQAMASMPVRPRRSVVFLHVSGEEKGLLGSRWFSDHPTVPLGRVVGDINVDMIGRNTPDTIAIIGKAYTSLGGELAAVGAAHPELRLVLGDDVWPTERIFFRSDHFNFARKEVPAIFFFSGTHADYHQPGDEVQKIDTDKAARVARMVFYLATDVANAPGRPQWVPSGLAEVRAMTR